MKHAVIGCGVVGNEHVSWLREAGQDVIEFDPPRGKQPALTGVKVAWVCVPTPLTMPAASLDLGPLVSALEALSDGCLVVIRSTVPPGTTDEMQARFPGLRIAFVPEFLTERRARRDFRYPARSIIGLAGATAKDANALRAVLPRAPYETTVPAATAETIKCASNAFYALKVSYWNQVFDLCEASGVDYPAVRKAQKADPMTGAQHLNVHQDGFRGFGGKCLPKDTLALYSAARANGVDMSLLREALTYNGRIIAAHAREQGCENSLQMTDSVSARLTRG